MKMIGVSEAAKILGASETTVRRWTNAGLIPCYRIGIRKDRKFIAKELRDTLQTWRNIPRRPPDGA